MPKTIVICCDGTNGQFSLQNTNVVRLYSLLDHGPLRQATFYDPGLGTMGAMGAWTPWAQQFTKLLGLAFGYGLKDRIGCAYEHLMSAYEEGDRIYLFGFSRGAYTVRALAALLHMFGLIRKGNENLVPYVTNMFGRGSEQVFALARRFKPAFSRECPIHFLGLWDTVKSVGWIYDPRSLPYTTDNPSVSIVRHAVSIDERRCFFRQNLWKASPGQDVQQLWFAGVHSDVGGGYPENQSGLANIALREGVLWPLFVTTLVMASLSLFGLFIVRKPAVIRSEKSSERNGYWSRNTASWRVSLTRPSATDTS